MSNSESSGYHQLITEEFAGESLRSTNSGIFWSAYRKEMIVMSKLPFLSLLGLLVLAGCKPQAEIEREKLAKQQEVEAAAAAAKAEKQNEPARVAGVGVGAKGRSFDNLDSSNPANIYAAPAKAFFDVKERVVFEIQIPQMMNFYKATNGNFPKSHEAFMQEIQNNKIQLPPLPEGRVYRYRPEEGELYVEPAKQ
jgi:hypothetical protein